MPINSRRKGANGELELFGMLSMELGLVVKRNLEQTRNGGADTISIPGWAVEVKRQKGRGKSGEITDGQVEGWWLQTVQQAELLNARPVLFFRKDRGSWKVCIPLRDLSPDCFNGDSQRFAILDFASSCQFIRAHL